MAKTITEKEADLIFRESMEEKEVEKEKSLEHVPDFQAIEESAGFRELMRKKKRFLIPTTILFLGLYLIFNLVISYTNLLDASFIGDISWAWVFAFSLFIMTWVLVTVYMKKAARFDKMAKETLKEFGYDKEANQ